MKSLKYSAAVLFALLVSMLSAGEVAVGMDKAAVIQRLGKPAKELGTAEKSILYWDAVVVTFRNGKVASFEEKTAPARRAPSEKEAAFLSTAREISRGFTRGLAKDGYARLVADLEQAVDALRGASVDERLVLRMTEYAEAHRTLLNMWNTEVALDAEGRVIAPKAAAPNSKWIIFVSREKNPAGFALIAEAVRHHRYKPASGDGESYVIGSVNGLWNFTEWRYWNPIESRLRELNITF